MSHSLRAVVSLLVLLSPAVFAEDRVVYAPVESATPVYQTRVSRIPDRECHVREVRVQEPVSPTGALFGGIVGAAIGNAVGHHTVNKQVGAVAGGMLGASMGHDAAVARSGERYREDEVCDVVYRDVSDEQIVGYDVSYTWEGQHYHTRLQRHPGNAIRLRVSVEPWE